MWVRSAKARFIMKITALVFLLRRKTSCWTLRFFPFFFFLICLWTVPYVSAENPKGSGVENQSGDEEQQVEVGVHLFHVVLPFGQIMATRWGGVDHRPLPQLRCIWRHSFPEALEPHVTSLSVCLQPLTIMLNNKHL